MNTQRKSAIWTCTERKDTMIEHNIYYCIIAVCQRIQKAFYGLLNYVNKKEKRKTSIFTYPSTTDIYDLAIFNLLSFQQLSQIRIKVKSVIMHIIVIIIASGLFCTLIITLFFRTHFNTSQRFSEKLTIMEINTNYCCVIYMFYILKGKPTVYINMTRNMHHHLGSLLFSLIIK